MNYILTLTVLLTENGELIIVLSGLYAFTYILRKKLFVVFCLFHSIVQNQGPAHSIQVL